LQCSSFTIGHLLELAAPETLLPKNGAAAAVSVGHGGCGEFVFGQDRGDRGVEMGGVVEVFDVGAVDAEMWWIPVAARCSMMKSATRGWPLGGVVACRRSVVIIVIAARYR